MTTLKKGRAKKPADGIPIRVLSYNIHQGITVSRRQMALSILKDAIKSLKADIVLLQEVAGTAREGERNTRADWDFASTQLETLADEIWPYHAYGKNAVFAGGFHGNAILSRFRITKWKHVDISVKGLPRRGMLHAELHIPEHDLCFHTVGTHLGLLQYERHRQTKFLVEYLKKEVPAASPLFMGGDFNDWRQHVSRRLAEPLNLEEAFLQQNAKHARTFPSRFPVLRLDRIYFRSAKLKLANRLKGKPWLFLSDHLPLVADFVLPVAP